MCDATHGERRSMPGGIWHSQNDIAWPKSLMLMSRPGVCRRYASAERPYGPAPIMATDTFSIGWTPPSNADDRCDSLSAPLARRGHLHGRALARAKAGRLIERAPKGCIPRADERPG